MGDMVLSAQNLGKSFGGITATANVNLALKRGARQSLTGPNGAGKTTHITLMTGERDPSKGRNYRRGEEITKLSPHLRVRRGMVRTFQINQLFSSLTPLETLAMTITHHIGLGTRWWQPLGKNPEVIARAEQLLEQFHLTEAM